MALNPNHSFEELDGIKCSIAEKNVGKDRAAYLKKLLEINGFTVVVAAAPAKKAPPPKPAADGAPATEPIPAPEPELFVVGVTDLRFNPIMAVYNRELKNEKGEIVSPEIWENKEPKEKEYNWYWK